MKILLISNMYPDSQNPSYGIFVKNTEEILLKEGFWVDKIVLYKEKSKIKKFIKYIFHYLKIVFRCLFYKYDVVYVHYAAHNSIPLNIVKRIKNIKIYTNVHGSDIVPEVKSQEKFQIHVSKLLQHSNKIITPSNYYKELVSKKYSIYPEKIKVFPSGGVNISKFYYIEREKCLGKLSLPKNYRYIGYVGRIDVKKGWDIFLRALKLMKDEGRLNNIKAIIVGHGKQSEMLEEMINEYELSQDLFLYNLLPQSDLKYIYNAIDVFCFPSMREGESLGLVGLESMACGTPIIASRIGGILDYTIDGVNGFLFNPGDADDLKSKIYHFFSLSDDQKEILINECINTAKKYEVNVIKPKLIEIFKDHK